MYCFPLSCGVLLPRDLLFRWPFWLEILSSWHQSIPWIWLKVQSWKSIRLFSLQMASWPEYLRGSAHPNTYPEVTPTQAHVLSMRLFSGTGGNRGRRRPVRREMSEVLGSCPWPPDACCRGRWGRGGQVVLPAGAGRDTARWAVFPQHRCQGPDAQVPAAILEFRGSWSRPPSSCLRLQPAWSSPWKIRVRSAVL